MMGDFLFEQTLCGGGGLKVKFELGSKKLLILSALMASVALNAETVSAVEFYNEAGLLAVLKKNSVVSERDVLAIKNEYPKLELKGSLQFQYINAGTDPAGKKINEMDLRRANFSLIGRLSEKVSLVIEPEYGKGLAPIRDAFISYRSPLIGIFAGNHRVPFSAEALQNDLNLRFVERSLASQISPDRMVGVSALASLLDNRLMVQAGLWNSNINSKSEAVLINNKLGDNQIFSTLSGNGGDGILIQALRVGFSTTGREDFYARAAAEDEGFNAGAGFSFYNSSPATNNVTNTGVTALNGAKAYEADLFVKFGRFAGEFEYANRNLDWWQFSNLTTSAASSAQTSYAVGASAKLIENFSLAARMESFVYDGNGKILKGAYGQDQDKWTTLGLAYFSKENNSKIMLNYVAKQAVMPAGASAPSSNTVQVQASTFF